MQGWHGGAKQCPHPQVMHFVDDRKIIGNAVILRNMDNINVMNLSPSERAMLNQIIHNDEPVSRKGAPNPYGGPENKNKEAGEAINKILANHGKNMEGARKDFANAMKGRGKK